MLPSLYQTPYQKLHQQIQDLEQAWASLGRVQAMANLTQIEQFFHKEILSLDEALLEAAAVDPSQRYTLRSYQTEIHKQLQLLKMDLPFWFAARQPDKQSLRSQQISERFAALSQYLERVLQLSDEPSAFLDHPN